MNCTVVVVIVHCVSDRVHVARTPSPFSGTRCVVNSLVSV